MRLDSPSLDSPQLHLLLLLVRLDSPRLRLLLLLRRLDSLQLLLLLLLMRLDSPQLRLLLRPLLLLLLPPKIRLLQELLELPLLLLPKMRLLLLPPKMRLLQLRLLQLRLLRELLELFRPVISRLSSPSIRLRPDTGIQVISPLGAKMDWFIQLKFESDKDCYIEITNGRRVEVRAFSWILCGSFSTQRTMKG
jgi:hypothetical protein